MNINDAEIKIKELESVINIKFNNIKFLLTALTHRSFLNEHVDGEIEHNERLEFLGDAVLELLITEYLYAKYPDHTEGELTSFRAAVVKTESLSESAQNLKIGQYLLISKGEEMTGGREKPYLLANTFEAILGAIYLDQGYEKAKEFVNSTLVEKIENIVKFQLYIDSKSKLQELAQEVVNITPVYELVDAVGPDHNKEFTMKVMIGEHEFGVGSGRSKQIAEQQAAQNALADWANRLTKSGLQKTPIDESKI